MDTKLLNLAEKAGMTYKANLGVFQFYYFELEEFYKLCIEEYEQEKSNKDNRIL